jgi:hypothetical protein
MKMRVTVSMLVSCAFALTMAGPSAAADWKIQRLPFQPRVPGQADVGPLLGISCTSRSLCVTGGHLGQMAFSPDPAAGAGAWRLFQAPEGSDYSGPPAPPGAPPNRPTPHVRGVACPSEALCVAVSGSGDVYSSTDPLAGEAGWSRADIDGEEYDVHLEGISCPTTSFCIAVSGGPPQNNNPSTRGKVLSSHDPAAGASAWKEVQLDPSLDLRGVSCASSSLCVGVGQGGRMVVSTNPDGPASAWREVSAGLSHLQGIGCARSGLCVAGNAAGELLVNSDPAGHPLSWTAEDGGSSVPITGVSCPTGDACLAVDNNGGVISSLDAAAARPTWSRESVLPYAQTADGGPPLNGMFGVSCPSPVFCTIAGADGTVLTSTNPFKTPAETQASLPDQKRSLRKRPRTILAHVDRKRQKTAKRRARVRFRFYSPDRTTGFICKRDRRPYRRCRSPLAYWTTVGKHVFRVRAIGPTGLKGPVAIDRFRIYPSDAKCPCARRD